MLNFFCCPTYWKVCGNESNFMANRNESYSIKFHLVRHNIIQNQCFCSMSSSRMTWMKMHSWLTLSVWRTILTQVWLYENYYENQRFDCKVVLVIVWSILLCVLNYNIININLGIDKKMPYQQIRPDNVFTSSAFLRQYVG